VTALVVNAIEPLGCGRSMEFFSLDLGWAM